MDETGQLEHVDSIPTQPDADRFTDDLCKLIERTRDAAQAERHLLAGIGVAIAGFLDPGREHLVYNSNLGWLEGYPLRKRLLEKFNMKVELEADSNAACLAEYRFGSGKGSHRFLCIVSGTGLGIGMAIDGMPLRFAYGCMGDMGHIIVQRNGPPCTCGGRGCAEILVSAPAISGEYKKRAGAVSAVSLRDVIEAAESRDETAIAVLEEAGEWLGIAIASMANTLFPDHISIAGGLSAAGDFVLRPAERAFRESAAVLARYHTTFTRAKLGTMATLIGAAWPFWNGNLNSSGE